jgi:trans-aconitate methyltransferase
MADLDAFVQAYGEGFPYSLDNEIILGWYPDRVLDRAPTKASLLELGIGHGFATPKFSRHFRRHVVLEGSPAVIHRFRESHPDCRAQIVEGRFETFQTSERFDTIVMGFVLEHVDEPQAILQRFRRFLAPGGRCYVAVPNGQSLHRRLGHEAGMLDDMMALGQADLELGHQRLYSVETLRQELDQAGYRIASLEGIFLKPFTTGQLNSLQLSPSVLRALCQVGVPYPELCCALLAEAVAVGG